MTRIQSLDGLRGVAVLAVLAMHAAFATPSAGREFADLQLFRVLAYGWLGVDCFFVLSGFLITSILLTYRQQMNASRSLRQFYVRRGLRIMPIYYLYLIVLLALLQRSEPQLRELGWLATYTQNVFWPLYGSNLWPWVGHLWSLAIEQHFYLFWPLVVLFVRPRRMPAVIGCLIGAVALLRCAAMTSDWTGALYMSTLTRADSLLAGALLSYLLTGSAPRLTEWMDRHSGSVCIVSFGIYVAAQAWFRLDSSNPFNLSIGYTVFAVACAALIHALMKRPGRLTRALERPGMVLTGQISYGIYVYHMAVFVVLKVVFSNWVPGWNTGAYFVDFLAFLLVAFGLTFGIAWISFRYIERPLLALRPGLPPSCGGPEGSVVALERARTPGPELAGS